MGIKINKTGKSIEINCKVENDDVILNYFSKLPNEAVEEAFIKALHIGCLALEEDRISVFLERTKNEIGCELEALGRRYNSSAKVEEVQMKSASKGAIAENDIAQILSDYVTTRSWGDDIQLTGNTTGNIRRNKTGDIVCFIQGTDNKIVIECKMSKAVQLGDISSVQPLVTDLRKPASDTAWSQLVEAEANRGGVPIIVFDKNSVKNTLVKKCQNVSFEPGIGFIVIIDSEIANYNNLFIAYDLARDIASHPCNPDVDINCLNFLIKGLVRDVNQILEIEKDIRSNFASTKAFTNNVLEKLKGSQLMLEMNKKYLQKYLNDGKLTKEDWLRFYQGDDNFQLLKDELREEVLEDLSN